MWRVKQVLSFGLPVAGVLLVFVGLTRSVGFSLIGIIASLAAVVALLYSGAVSFGVSRAPHPEKPDTIFVFDRTFRLVSGIYTGLPIRAILAEIPAADLEYRCGAVFARRGASLPMHVDVAPVRDADGTVVFGILIANAFRHAAPSARV